MQIVSAVETRQSKSEEAMQCDEFRYRAIFGKEILSEAEGWVDQPPHDSMSVVYYSMSASAMVGIISLDIRKASESTTCTSIDGLRQKRYSTRNQSHSSSSECTVHKS